MRKKNDELVPGDLYTYGTSEMVTFIVAVTPEFMVIDVPEGLMYHCESKWFYTGDTMIVDAREV